MNIEPQQTIVFFAMVATFGYFIAAFLFQLELLYIAQLKEYKLYRLIDFIRSKKGKQQLLFHPYILISIVGVVLQVVLTENIFIGYVVALIIFWIYRMYKRKIYRPVFTAKAKVLTSLAVFGQFFSGIIIGLIVLAFFRTTNPFITLLVLFAVFPIVWVLLWTQILQIPTYFAKRYYITKATKKIATYSDLKVIGITGSYGKTSTRNYLVQILSTKYNVVTTPKNINTEIGVARFILDHDFSSDEIFVVEMGAYRKGEIKLIADMVQPTIGIITTVGPEHLALFGSMKNIQLAKGELFAALPKGGLAITNADNAYCRGIVETYKHVNIQTFGTSQLHHPTLLISSVEQQKDGIVATYNYEGQDIDINAPLFGTHNAMNIASSLLAAQHVGMDIADILTATNTLTAPLHRLNRIEKGSGVVVLDDSYNSNPEGFLEALDVLAMQEQEKKVVITRGMLELGEKEAEEHVRIGKRIGEVADTVIIISADNAAHLKRGIVASDRNIEIIDDYDMRSVAARYRAIIESGNVAVLLENKVPDLILNTLSS